MRIVFLGTPEFAVPSLAALCGSPVEVAAVFTQPDRPAGRGRKPAPPPVKIAAEARGLEVHQPEKIRARDIAPLSPDAAVVVAYGQILSRKFIETPPLGAWNLHASLLPRWRGAAPIQRAILAGDAECGVCVMRIIEELDAGPVIAQRAIPIGPSDTSEDLHDRLAGAGAALMVESLLQLESGAAAETPQDASRVTYAEKLSKEEAQIDWRLPAAELDRSVRGLRPWPVAETAWPGVENGPVRIWRATPEPEENTGLPPGTVLGTAEEVRVAAGAGALLLLEIQPPGGRRMAAVDFLRGNPLSEGAVLGSVS